MDNFPNANDVKILAPPMIWVDELEREVERTNPDGRIRLVDGAGVEDVDISEDEAPDVDWEPDAERPPDAPPSYVARPVFLPEASRGGECGTPHRGGGERGAASSSPSNPPRTLPCHDPPSKQWRFHFHIVGTPN